MGSTNYMSKLQCITCPRPYTGRPEQSFLLLRSLPVHTELGVGTTLDSTALLTVEVTLELEVTAPGEVALVLGMVVFGGQLASGTSSGQTRSLSNGTLIEGSSG